MTPIETRIKVVEILEATTGGTARHLEDLALHIDKARFEVSVICSTFRDPAFLVSIAKMKEAGILVEDIPMWRAIRPLHDFVAFFRILKFLKKKKPDIVHTHSSKAGFLGRLAARLAGVCLIVHTPHGFAFEMEVSASAKAFYRCLEGFAARFCDVMICVSNSEKSVAVGAGITTEGKCVVVPNGIKALERESYEQYRIKKRRDMGVKDDQLVVGSVGRITRQKGYEYFVSAAERLAVILPNVTFLLLGDGERSVAIDNLIKQSGMGDRCIFRQAAKDVSHYFSVFDIFVITSLWEGLPYVMLEAMAASCAVVAFNAGGIGDVVRDGDNGMLVDKKDINGLVSAIVRLANNAHMRKELGARSREMVIHDYTLEKMVRQIEHIYNREVPL